MFNLFTIKPFPKYHFICPCCGERLSSLNQYGDYSCDYCHKLYTHSGLMEAYIRLTEENHNLKVTREFHKIATDSADKELQKARKRIQELEKELNRLRLEVQTSNSITYKDRMDCLEMRLKYMESLHSEVLE